MKTLTAALLASAMATAPLAASAQVHVGHSAVHSAGVRGFGGFRGGGFRGFGGFRGCCFSYGAFGLGLALGAAWDPWGYGYYPYYGYYPTYYYGPGYPPPYDYDYDAPPPPSYSGQGAPSYSGQARAPQQQACGKWVWRADQNKYEWDSSGCA